MEHRAGPRAHSFPRPHTSFPRLGSELRDEKVAINTDTGIWYTEPRTDLCTDHSLHGVLVASDFTLPSLSFLIWKVRMITYIPCCQNETRQHMQRMGHGTKQKAFTKQWLFLWQSFSCPWLGFLESRKPKLRLDGTAAVRGRGFRVEAKQRGENVQFYLHFMKTQGFDLVLWIFYLAP